MQRAPWLRRRFSSRCGWNSFQSPMRSSGARSTGSSRRYSMNPVGLPIVATFVLCRRSPSIPADPCEVARVLLEGHHDRFLADEALLLGARDAREHPLVVLRDHLDELRQQFVPGVEHAPGALAGSVLEVALD